MFLDEGQEVHSFHYLKIFLHKFENLIYILLTDYVMALKSSVGCDKWKINN